MDREMLSKRLAAIVRLIDRGSIVCDVGADHGYVSIKLSKDRIADRVYAIENKKGPYLQLQKNIAESRSSAIALFADGLESLPPDVDTVIIAGMGARNIINILDKDKDKLVSVKTLVVDSHTDLAMLRERITLLGFYIADEEMVEDKKKIYAMIKFKKGIRHYVEEDFIFGPILRVRKDNLYHEFWSDESLRIDALITKKRIGSKRRNELLILKERINKNL
ncbi:MAG: class I SAM-dependent methyltransferase [Bacilli bacterium]